MKKHRNVAVLILLLVAVLSDWWIPNLSCVLFKLGVTSPMEVGGVRLQMKDCWFPARSSERGLWKLNAKYPSIVLAKAKGYPFQKSFPYVSIGKVSPGDADILRKDGPHRVDVKSYPWGTAVLLVGRKAAFIDEYGLVISVNDASESDLFFVLSQIVAINKQ